MHAFALALLLAGCRGGMEYDTVPTGDDTGEVDPGNDLDADGFTDDVDCDDADPSINPEAAETCDGADQDCDGVVDNDAIDAAEHYADADGDGHGDAATSVVDCDPGPGWVLNDDDCDDEHSGVFPGNDESCDGEDNNCDGAVDEGLLTATYYVDGDGDGYGSGAGTVTDCAPQAGYVAGDTDCDDGASDIHPGAPELCDSGVDEDCDAGTSCDGYCMAEFDFSACDAMGPYSGPAPVVEWNYDIGGSADVNDAVGFVHGSYIGTPLSVPGVSGNGVELDGGSWVSASAPAPLNLSTYTMMTWVRTPPGAAGLDFVMTTGNGNPAWTGTGLLFNGDQISSLFEAGGGGFEILFDAGPVCTDEWTHLATTFDNGQITVYEDGIEVAARSAPYTAIT